MEKLTEVLGMNGFGAYVWPSFAIAALVMAALALVSMRGLRRASRMMAQLQNASEQ